MPGRALQDASDQHEDHAEPDSRTPSQAVTNVKTCQRSYQRPKFKSSNDNALDSGIVHLGEYRCEWALGDDTSLAIISWNTLQWKFGGRSHHDRHVIAEKPKGACSNGRYGEVEWKTLQPQGRRVRGELEHVASCSGVGRTAWV
jgi:hypothetical protein